MFAVVRIIFLFFLLWTYNFGPITRLLLNMTNEIPNLWPTDAIVVNALTPAAILRYQVPLLRQSTQGLLDAEVTTVNDDKNVEMHLDVVAPALRNYRHRLVSIYHKKNLVYPVSIASEGNAVYSVISQDDFIQRLKSILTSAQTIAVLQSLLARSNEENQTEESVEPTGMS